MEGDYITKEVHEEFARRIETEHMRLSEEDKRQNRRIDKLEENVEAIHSLTASMERMSANMQSMLEAIERQGKLIEKQTDRIDVMEKEPAKDSKQIKMSIITTVVSAFVAAAVGAIITLL